MEVYADTNIFSKFHRILSKSEEIFPINNVFVVRASTRPEIGKSPEWFPVFRCNAIDAGNQLSQTGSTTVLSSENSRGSTSRLTQLVTRINSVTTKYRKPFRGFPNFWPSWCSDDKNVVYRKDFFGFCRYAMEFRKDVCVSVNFHY